MSSSGPPKLGTEERTEMQEEPTAWTGWVAFAGIMMIVLGVFNALDCLVALLNSNWLVDNTQLPFTSVNYTAWGWTWITPVHPRVPVLVAADYHR